MGRYRYNGRTFEDDASFENYLKSIGKKYHWSGNLLVLEKNYEDEDWGKNNDLLYDKKFTWIDSNGNKQTADTSNYYSWRRLPGNSDKVLEDYLNYLKKSHEDTLSTKKYSTVGAALPIAASVTPVAIHGAYTLAPYISTILSNPITKAVSTGLTWASRAEAANSAFNALENASDGNWLQAYNYGFDALKNSSITGKIGTGINYVTKGKDLYDAAQEAITKGNYNPIGNLLRDAALDGLIHYGTTSKAPTSVSNNTSLSDDIDNKVRNVIKRSSSKLDSKTKENIRRGLESVKKSKAVKSKVDKINKTYNRIITTTELKISDKLGRAKKTVERAGKKINEGVKTAKQNIKRTWNSITTPFTRTLFK